MMRIGVDIGGTNIKIGAVDGSCLTEKVMLPTPADVNAILDDITEQCGILMARYPIQAIGIGSPGTLTDDRHGLVCAANLPFSHSAVTPVLESRLGVPVYLENDANCAALGECRAGLEKEIENAILLTIGTGIGGGLILHRQVYRGKRGIAGELGHMCIQLDGPACGCGGKGCLERYASVTALVEQTRKAAEERTDSLLAKLILSSGGKIDGRTPFLAARLGCPLAKTVLNRYLTYLEIGIRNLVWIFEPEEVILSGEISREEKDLIEPLRRSLESAVKIRASRLQADAGIVGAAYLADWYGEEEERHTSRQMAYSGERRSP